MTREPISITHHVGLNRTPALPLAVQGWQALIQSGHCSNFVQVKEEHEALLASIDGEVAGVMTFWADPMRKELVIGIGYVSPEYRGFGLYARLWEALVAEAQTRGLAHISSSAYLDNGTMRRVAQAQGRVERWVALDFTVPPQLP